VGGGPPAISRLDSRSYLAFRIEQFTTESVSGDKKHEIKI
jgi:hypothetical protein